MTDNGWNSWVHTEKKSGTIDEVMSIKALAGIVEIALKSDTGSVTLFIPSEGIDELIKRLSTARDAAALMKSG